MIEPTRLRSLLFVPAADERKLRRARTAGADALIIDLEDSVPASELPRARRLVATFLADPPAAPVFVRTNHPASSHFAEDVGSAVAPALAGVVIPKVDSPEDIDHVVRALEDAESTAGVGHDAVVLPLLESGRGIRRAFDIASRSPRVAGLAFSSGEQGDFMADIDGIWTPDGAAMAYARGRTVAECRAAGLSWPVDGVFMALGDPAALERECRLARSYGFQAKMAIHPDQVPVIHRVFTPTHAEVDQARRTIGAYREAARGGSGAVRVDGRMVDLANVLHAEHILARARSVG